MGYLYRVRYKEYVFQFEVGVSEFVAVTKGNGVEQLIGDDGEDGQREPAVLILLNVVIQRFPAFLKHQARVLHVVNDGTKRFVQPDDQRVSGVVQRVQFVEDIHLNVCCVQIPLHRAHDLHRHAHFTFIWTQHTSQSVQWREGVIAHTLTRPLSATQCKVNNQCCTMQREDGEWKWEKGGKPNCQCTR